MEKLSGALQGLLAHILWAAQMHPTFKLTHGPFACDAMNKPACLLSLLKLQTLGKTVKIIGNGSFMLKELLIPVSPPDFPISLLSIYFSSLCAHWLGSLKALMPVERKQIFTDTSCWPFWAHSPGPGVRACLRTWGKRGFRQLCLHTGMLGSDPDQQQSWVVFSPPFPLTGWALGSLQVPGEGGVPCTGLSVKSISVTRRTLTLDSNSDSHITQQGKFSTSAWPGLMNKEAVRPVPFHTSKKT